ncbi:MAG: hypothetical protein ACLQNE_40125 [Thermoguttaceae bacterium]
MIGQLEVQDFHHRFGVGQQIGNILGRNGGDLPCGRLGVGPASSPAAFVMAVAAAWPKSSSGERFTTGNLKPGLTW